MSKSKMTRERRIEIALLLKKVKDISEGEVAEFSGITRQALNLRMTKERKNS